MHSSSLPSVAALAYNVPCHLPRDGANDPPFVDSTVPGKLALAYPLTSITLVSSETLDPKRSKMHYKLTIDHLNHSIMSNSHLKRPC